VTELAPRTATWRTPSGLALELVLVPEGEFLVGSRHDDEDAWPDESPQRVESLARFWIARTPITWAQYRHFASATRAAVPPAPAWGTPPDHPVVNVTWSEANAFASWAGLGIPSELEWEKAGRGPTGPRYPWGDEAAPARALWRDHPAFGSVSTAPVGTIGADVSCYGVADVAGNVREWCVDVERTGKAAVRGGSWRSDAGTGRLAFRGRMDPNARNPDLGFRVVLRGLDAARFAQARY
jgi:formylglycine-generating enzyme required for sulfatase activity